MLIEHALFPVRIRDKWGFINCKGDIVIDCTFDDADEFSEGLAAVKIDKMWGYIDACGDIVMGPSFRYASMFSEGLAYVRTGDGGSIGYINRSGDIVITPKFEAANTFSEGLAAVKENGESGYGFIDTMGKYVIDPNPDIVEARGFLNGLAVVKRKKGCSNCSSQTSQFIDTSGNIAISTFFYVAFDFHEGLAAVKMAENYIDPRTRDVEGLIVRCGYVDTKGQIAISDSFYDCTDFNNGLAIVSMEKGKYVIIDSNGRIQHQIKIKGTFWRARPGTFWGARPFSEGLAAIESAGGGWGYVDTNGRMIVSPQFREARDFKSGLGQVRIEYGKFPYYLNTSGDMIWKP